MKYKIFPFDTYPRYSIGIGKIALHEYLYYLTEKRLFNKTRVLSYTMRIYGIDLTTEISNLDDFYWKIADICDLYMGEYPSRINANDSRDYFATVGRKYFMKFLDYCGKNDNEDTLLHWYPGEDVHHIMPLYYGGKNSLDNLILLSYKNHCILHKNPYEDDEQRCYQALDYMAYLYSEEMRSQIADKYNLDDLSDRLFLKVFSECVEEEMLLFYKIMNRDLAKTG